MYPKTKLLLPNDYAIIPMILPLGMDSKAHGTEGTSRVTSLAIAPYSFATFSPWMVDVFHLPHSKLLFECHVVLSPLMLLPLSIDMVGQ